jgi:hypothetical protein
MKDSKYPAKTLMSYCRIFVYCRFSDKKKYNADYYYKISVDLFIKEKYNLILLLINGK